MIKTELLNVSKFQIKTGDLVATVFDDDKKWYRAEVVEVIHDDYDESLSQVPVKRILHLIMFNFVGTWIISAGFVQNSKYRDGQNFSASFLFQCLGRFTWLGIP